MANILIIDDDELLQESLSSVITNLGHAVTAETTLRSGLKKVSEENFDVVFLDVRMPDGSGLNYLRKIKDSPSSPEVIIITGLGDPEGAELAIKSGAWDYIEKPTSIKKMTLPLMRALEYRKEKNAIQKRLLINREELIGNSPCLKVIWEKLAQAANNEANVLITGETGVGKEPFAFAVHKNSKRAENHFVIVDCATLPENLIESVLFGHEKGSFTGAIQNKQGLIQQADKGTLFLDEIGELPLQLQKTFLRVLQERRFRPVGSNKEISSNFRLIAATNRDLEKMVKEGRFREDLLFRLKTISVEIPPLRKRKEDIISIAQYYLKKFSEQYGIESKVADPGFYETLESYDWPGNIRELINVIESAFSNVSSNETTLFARHLPIHIRIQKAQSTLTEKNSSKPTSPKLEEPPKFEGISEFTSLKKFRENSLAKIETQYLEQLISFTKGNVKEICRIANLSRSRLYELLQKYNINLHDH